MANQESFPPQIIELPGFNRLEVEPTPDNTRVVLYVNQPEFNHIEITKTEVEKYRLFFQTVSINVLGGLAIPYGDTDDELIEQQAEFLRQQGSDTAKIDIFFEPDIDVIESQKRIIKQIGGLIAEKEIFVPEDWVTV